MSAGWPRAVPGVAVLLPGRARSAAAVNPRLTPGRSPGADASCPLLRSASRRRPRAYPIESCVTVSNLRTARRGNANRLKDKTTRTRARPGRRVSPLPHRNRRRTRAAGLCSQQLRPHSAQTTVHSGQCGYYALRCAAARDARCPPPVLPASSPVVASPPAAPTVGHRGGWREGGRRARTA